MNNNGYIHENQKKEPYIITENFENVWVGNKISYLNSINDTNSKGISYCSTDIIPESSLKTYIGTVDEEGKYLQSEQLEREHVLTAQEFSELFDTDIHNSYTLLNKACRKLSKIR